MMNLLYLLTIALGVTQLLDWYTTRTILNHPGGYEQNPIMAKLFGTFGVDPSLAIKAVTLTGLGYWIGTQEIRVLAVLVVVYVVVIIHNWKSMP